MIIPIKHLKKFLKYFFQKSSLTHPILKREKWADINGYEGLYKISNKGRIISLSRERSRGNQFLKPIIREGYYTTNLSKNKKKKAFFVHRLVAKAFIPNPNNLETVNHKNFYKWDNTVWNLEWMSNLDNVQHAIDNGKMCAYPRKPVGKIEARICTCCDEMKPIEEFYNNYTICKSCAREKNQEYYYKDRNDISLFS